MDTLNIKNISYRYKRSDQDVLKGLSCSFEPGIITAIVGQSGSGKTTLLSIMAGLDKPTDGHIYFGDRDLNQIDLDHYRSSQIAMIFQGFHLFPFLTALENVCYPMEQNGINDTEAKEKAEELLASVGLTPDHMKRFPANLSGGEQQRVAIARALANGAKVILADEPTGNLDEENGEIVFDILENLACEKNYCIIVVTHDMTMAARADKVLYLRKGQLSETQIIKKEPVNFMGNSESLDKGDL